jgi:hypothetical protein
VSKTLSLKWKAAISLRQTLGAASRFLRRLKDAEVIRTLSANASTVKALQGRGLIRAAKGHDPLTIIWRLKKK